LRPATVWDMIAPVAYGSRGFRLTGLPRRPHATLRRFVVSGLHYRVDIDSCGRRETGQATILQAPKSKNSCLRGIKVLVASSVALAVLPVLLRGQTAARDALSAFPADTQQLAYSNLSQLRSLPDYPQLRLQLFSQQIRDFEEFLHSTGTDPDKDVDEVTLGWRGELQDPLDYFGLAWGRFAPDSVHELFEQRKLPWREYNGYELYAFGSGEERRDIFFAFLSSSSAIFGRLENVQALIDTRAGTRPALESNSAFANWEGELEGTSPQWGIATGAAAAARVAPLLGGGGKSSIDPQVLLKPVHGVLFRVDWSSGFTSHMTVVCDSTETAAALAQFVILWRDSRQNAPANAKPSPEMMDLLQGMRVEADGSRLELTASGPIQLINQIFRGPASPSNSR